VGQGQAPAEPPAALEAPATVATKRASRLRTTLSVLVGLVLLGLVIYNADVDQIHERMDALKWRSPLVLLPWVLIAWLDARGWRCTLPPAAAHLVPLHSLVLVRMAGEAVNSLTPTAAVGGEPVKAHLLRAWGVAGSDSLASIVIAKTALTVTQSLFVVLGLAALFVKIGRPGLGAAWMAFLLLVTIVFARGLVYMQRRGPVGTVWRWLAQVMPRARFLGRLEQSVHAIDERLAEFYTIERGAFWRAGVWHMAGWLVGVVEVWLIMLLIGAPIGWLDALIIEALSQPIRAAAVIIPGGLGTQEVGGVALCLFLGMPAPEAATLWLLKRGRELVFDGAGLVYLLRRTTWSARAG
jgi:putative membrane protein